MNMSLRKVTENRPPFLLGYYGFVFLQLCSQVITDVKDSVVKKAKTIRAALRIRKHKPTFSTSSFPLEADAIYKEVHALLPKYAGHRLFLCSVNIPKVGKITSLPIQPG